MIFNFRRLVKPGFRCLGTMAGNFRASLEKQRFGMWEESEATCCVTPFSSFFRTVARCEWGSFIQGIEVSAMAGPATGLNPEPLIPSSCKPAEITTPRSLSFPSRLTCMGEPILSGLRENLKVEDSGLIGVGNVGGWHWIPNHEGLTLGINPKP